jgi:hypothetical protein
LLRSRCERQWIAGGSFIVIRRCGGSIIMFLDVTDFRAAGHHSRPAQASTAFPSLAVSGFCLKNRSGAMACSLSID